MPPKTCRLAVSTTKVVRPTVTVEDAEKIKNLTKKGTSLRAIERKVGKSRKTILKYQKKTVHAPDLAAAIKELRCLYKTKKVIGKRLISRHIGMSEAHVARLLRGKPFTDRVRSVERPVNDRVTVYTGFCPEEVSQMSSQEMKKKYGKKGIPKWKETVMSRAAYEAINGTQ